MPEIDSNISEFIGAMIGDGCISQYKPKGRSTKITMLLTGSWEKDVDYYKCFIHPLILKHFSYSGRLYHRKDDNTARFWINDKNIIKQFVDYGLLIGPKTNTIRIPKEIMNNKKLSIACLRGIFNTDGILKNIQEPA